MTTEKTAELVNFVKRLENARKKKDVGRILNTFWAVLSERKTETTLTFAEMEEILETELDALGEKPDLKKYARRVLDRVNEKQEIYPKKLDICSNIAEIRAAPEGRPLPWGSGFRNLVRIEPGMTVIAGATSHGKTSVALSIFYDIVKNSQKPVIFWSGELNRSYIFAKLVAIEAGVPLMDVLRVFRSDEITPEISDALAEIGKHAEKIRIISENTTVEKFLNTCRKTQTGQGLEAVFVDYLQLMPPTEMSRSREEEVAKTATFFRAMALELDIPVIAGAQLNRSNAKYAEKPALTQLRESGRIEQEAQLVLGVWNATMAGEEAESGETTSSEFPSVYYQNNKNLDKNGITLANSRKKVFVELSILKNRLRGGVGKAIGLLFDGATGRFEAAEGLKVETTSTSGSNDIPTGGSKS